MRHHFRTVCFSFFPSLYFHEWIYYTNQELKCLHFAYIQCTSLNFVKLVALVSQGPICYRTQLRKKAEAFLYFVFRIAVSCRFFEMISHFTRTSKFSPFPTFIFSLLREDQWLYHSTAEISEPISPKAPFNPQKQSGNSAVSGNLKSKYSSLLRSCVASKALNPGKQIHARLFVSGFAYNELLGTKLVNLYCVCGCLCNAHHLFDKISNRNLFLWNVLIRAYAWNGPYEAAISLYKQLIEQGLVPDNFTFPFVLKACSALSAIKEGKDIHERAKLCGLESDIFVGAALIDMYAKCGFVETARSVFDKMKVKDDVLWNSMLAAYSQNGHPDECISLCSEMVLEGLRPTEATLVPAISASAGTAALPRGKELHGFSWRRGFERNDKVNTALLDMYAKRGSITVARSLFEWILVKRVVSWNAMITGYAMHGHNSEALSLFEEMKGKSQPDHITFVGVLQACNHGGWYDEGRKFFDSLQRDYHINPTVQHYTCMIDLLGHCGLLDEAYDLIKQMKVSPDSGVWGALLNSCKIHGNVELGEIAVKRLINLQPDEAGYYVILSNMYAQAGKWEKVANIRKLMTDKGMKKSIACSWIELKNEVHAFLTGDTSHPMSNETYAELNRLGELMRRAGYVPNTGTVFQDVDVDEKSNIVSAHSERLAMAFGLISTPPGSKLLITKNLRICEDCHVFMKFISKIMDREIIVRDVNRYHQFKNGVCSCGDYW